MPFNVGGKIWNGGMAKEQAWISDPASTVITRGLVAHLDATNISSYTGAGTTWTDLSGDGYNATLNNTPTWTGGTSGYFNFDGSNEYAVIADNAALRLTTFTFSAWVIADDVTDVGGDYLTLYDDRETDSSGNGFFLGIYDSTQTWMAAATSAGGFLHHTGSTNYSGTVVSPGKWYHIALTVDETNDVSTLYENGILIGSNTCDGYTASTASKMIGKQAYGNTRYWDGKVSTVLINDRALSAAELTYIFNSQRSRYGV